MDPVQEKLKEHRERVLMSIAEVLSEGFAPSDKYQQCSVCKAVFRSYWKRHESGGCISTCREVAEEEAVAARLRGLVYVLSDVACASCVEKWEAKQISC